MLFEKIVKIIGEELNVSKDELTLETNLQTDLGADSLDAVELMMALEDEFGVQIPDEDAQNFKTIQDIVVFLENRK